jgi:hypothetical protein
MGALLCGRFGDTPARISENSNEANIQKRPREVFVEMVGDLK